MAEGYTTTYRIFEPMSQKIRPMQLEVAGKDKTKSTAGEFETWTLKLKPLDGVKAGGATLHVLATAPHHVVRGEYALPAMMGGGTMSAELTATGPAKKAKKGKIRREGNLTLDLVPTEDILAGLSAGKGDRLVVGFALETDNEIENAKRKLKDKKLDLVIANNPLREGAGFGSDTNCGHMVYPDGRVEDVPLMSKLDLSEKIFDAVSARLSSA